MDDAGAPVIDGYEDVSVGLVNLDLAIPRKVTKSYAAALAIGLDFAYTAADGRVLYSKKIQSIGRGEVDVTESSCEVKGLDKIAQDAMGYVTDGMAKQLGTSNKIIEAPARKAVRLASRVSPLQWRLRSCQFRQRSTAFTSSVATGAESNVDEPATVIFRAIVRNEHRNQVLHNGEAVAIEIEVKNEGPGTARAVELLVTGHADSRSSGFPAWSPSAIFSPAR